MTDMKTISSVGTEELTREQSRELMSQRVADRLGITLDRFVANADAGEYDGTEDRDVLRLLVLLPFAR